MEPGRLAKTAEIFQQALRVPPQERTIWLEAHCGSDLHLRSEVLSLLEHHAESDTFLETPVEVGRMLDGGPPPERIGAYEIEGVLGQGGMGLVYRASQDNPRRSVALKVIRNPFAGDELLRRFQHEAAVLARLEHPGIARIYEAGAAETDHGQQPFLAMELVDGEPLTDFAEARQLGLAARLELLVRVADAISHAHRKGVIHRDLKPGNILVDGNGQPRILDFGVARLTDGDVQATQHTHAGQVLGTLAYMSPEQARGDVHDLDTRADVYALGVLAYQLLSGRLPLDLRGANLASAARIIEEMPPAPLGKLDARLRGDVETIVHKALHKEVEQRYASASDFAADLRRHLKHEPIMARPAGLWYSARKFAMRHTGWVVGAALTLLALIGGVVVSSSAYLQAAHERESSERAVQFLGRMLQSTDPTELGADVRLVDVLDRAAEEVALDFADRPRIEADLRGVLGESYHQLAQFPKAAEQFRIQVELFEQDPGLAEDALLRARANYALALHNSSRYDEAEPIVRSVLADQERLLGRLHLDTISTLSNLGTLLRDKGDLEAALPITRDAYERAVQANRPEDIETLGPLNNLASLLETLDHAEEAAEMYEELIVACRAQLPPDDPRLMIAQNNYAAQLTALGRADEAVVAYEQLLETQQRVLSPLHRSTLLTRNNYAMTLRDLGRDEDAHDTLSALVDDLRDVPDPAWPYRYSFARNLALTLMDLEEFSAASALLDETRIASEQHLPPGHPVTAGVLELLGKVLLIEERYAEAEPHCRAALEIMLRFLPETHPKPQDVLADLADVLDGQGRGDEAEVVRGRLRE